MVEVIVEAFEESTGNTGLSITTSTWLLHRWRTDFLPLVHGKGSTEVLKCWKNSFIRYVSRVFCLGVVFFFSKRNLLERLQARWCQRLHPSQVYVCKNIRTIIMKTLHLCLALFTGHNSRKLTQYPERIFLHLMTRRCTLRLASLHIFHHRSEMVSLLFL